MSQLTLEQLGVTSTNSQVFSEQRKGDTETELGSSEKNNEESGILCHFDRIMSEKKMHEVLMMSENVSKLCQVENVSSLVDVGSGKAYLSQVLAAMQKHLNVLAIDSQSGNLKGAQKRSANLEVSHSLIENV